MYVSVTQLVLKIWTKNWMYPFHDFYDFDQQFLQTHKNLKVLIFWPYFQNMWSTIVNLPHLKALDQEFWPLWIQYGTRSKIFNTIGQSKRTQSFYSDIMYLHCINLRKVKEKFVFFVFFYFSTKWAEKMKKTLLLNKLTLRGAILLGPPCRSLLSLTYILANSFDSLDF